ncbi:MAG: GDP-mannose 4,6-dehydratase [Verrucomicrobia bacterium]|nr:GDP-mannose 4,6-dehydratase [Verrucomicrobiota bacterium]
MPRALITGINGQDGSYLTELLLDRGYEVHGLVRRVSTLNRSRLDHLYNNPQIYGQRLFLHYGDLDDPTTLRRILVKIEPDELYHLAGQSHVGLSFEIPESTCEMTAMGTLRLLEIMRDLNRPPKLFHAASSEIFGRPEKSPQDELTPFAPVSPYGCAKAFATRMVTIYRETYGLFACNGIMYNHESPRRGENFVTRKICHAAAAIKLGLEKELMLGDLTGRRDWGDARDYVRAMWLTLQHSVAEDFVFATGQLHSVQDVVETAFKTMQLDWQPYVKRDARFIRPAEPLQLVGNAAKARLLLNWEPKTSFSQLISEMTNLELSRLAVQSSKPVGA